MIPSSAVRWITETTDTGTGSFAYSQRCLLPLFGPLEQEGNDIRCLFPLDHRNDGYGVPLSGPLEQEGNDIRCLLPLFDTVQP